MKRIVSAIICSEYQDMKGPNHVDKAMRVRFRLRQSHEQEWQEDYYPRVDLILWSPSNYTKVLVQESDPHHFGEGPIVKIGDHDSCWRESVGRFLEEYEAALAGIDQLSGWHEVIDADTDAWSLEHGKLSDARFLPEVPGLRIVKAPPSIYEK